ncbi:hypothetical protein [Streptomyces sp. MI02-7b]|uniref:hypothetical protein n=1 Tax=Streptomyces sp. MI02-7b TaxID=462941 RepID=UPI0029AADBE9|nr:hypothetical protein [Streptomyces sp. MI02-7b]MDX3075509.1 hypothetical protein [Streptomyces sp. MI02-7b]
MTFLPPGGDGRDNDVDVDVDAGSGYGLAVAAVPLSRDAAMVPATRTAAAARRDLDR